MKRHLKTVVIIILLTLLFVFDDVLIFALFENVLELRLSHIWISGILTLLFALNLLFAWLVYRVLRKKPTTGSEGMRGKRGVVLAVRKTTGLQVRVEGEIWQAISRQPLSKGDKIVVEEISGLVLRVRKGE